MNLNILIAEDEENVGIALQAMVRSAYSNSTIVLATDGQEAWSKVQEQAFDLIISDWNMPLKTGDELLADVRGNAKTKHIPFIMLTARSDKDSVITAIQAGVTDYIRKPFDKQSLLDKAHKLLTPAMANLAVNSKGATAATSATSGATALTPIEEIALRLKAGETGFLILPDLALRIQELIKSGESSLEVLVEVIKLDPSLTARLIAVSNSTYYRADKECKTLQAAAIRIGFKETCDCALALSTRDLFKSDSVLFSDLLQKIWEHSLAVGCCAGLLANRLHVKSSDSYYTMGLLHDIGKLLLVKILKDLFKSGRIIDRETIYQALDMYHQQFGAELLRKWKYSEPFVELVLNHHDKTYLKQCAQGLMLVGVSNMLVQKIGLSLHEESAENFSDEEMQAILGLDQDAIDAVLEEVKGYVAEVKSLL